MTPDITHHNPDPAYLRDLIDQAGLSQREAARRLGVSERMMRQYLASRDAATAAICPYVVQFALEQLAEKNPENRKLKG